MSCSRSRKNLDECCFFERYIYWFRIKGSVVWSNTFRFRTYCESVTRTKMMTASPSKPSTAKIPWCLLTLSSQSNSNSSSKSSETLSSTSTCSRPPGHICREYRTPPCFADLSLQPAFVSKQAKSIHIARCFGQKNRFSLSFPQQFKSPSLQQANFPVLGTKHVIPPLQGAKLHGPP